MSAKLYGVSIAAMLALAVSQFAQGQQATTQTQAVSAGDLTEIIVTGGVAQGVRASSAGAEQRFNAPAVVVCAGGFASSHDLILEVAPQLRERVAPGHPRRSGQEL